MACLLPAATPAPPTPRFDDPALVGALLGAFCRLVGALYGVLVGALATPRRAREG